MVVELVDVLVLVELDVDVEVDVLLDVVDVDELVLVDVVVAQASSNFFHVAVCPLVAVWMKSLFVPV